MEIGVMDIYLVIYFSLSNVYYV